MNSKITHSDLSRIVSMSKANMHNISLPVTVSRKQLEPGEVPTLAVLESVLTYLNSKGHLKELISVDYTFEYDDNDMPDLEPKQAKSTVI